MTLNCTLTLDKMFGNYYLSLYPFYRGGSYLPNSWEVLRNKCSDSSVWRWNQYRFCQVTYLRKETWAEPCKVTFTALRSLLGPLKSCYCQKKWNFIVNYLHAVFIYVCIYLFIKSCFLSIGFLKGSHTSLPIDILSNTASGGSLLPGMLRCWSHLCSIASSGIMRGLGDSSSYSQYIQEVSMTFRWELQ